MVRLQSNLPAKEGQGIRSRISDVFFQMMSVGSAWISVDLKEFHEPISEELRFTYSYFSLLLFTLKTSTFEFYKKATFFLSLSLSGGIHHAVGPTGLTLRIIEQPESRSSHVGNGRILWPDLRILSMGQCKIHAYWKNDWANHQILCIFTCNFTPFVFNILFVYYIHDQFDYGLESNESLAAQRHKETFTFEGFAC